MLTEVTKNKHDDLDLSRILAGSGVPDASICADCDLCGTSGNDDSFRDDYFE